MLFVLQAIYQTRVNRLFFLPQHVKMIFNLYFLLFCDLLFLLLRHANQNLKLK